MRYLESEKNKEIKKLKKLKDRSFREKEGLFIIEGERLVFDAIKNNALIDSIYIDEDYEFNLNIDVNIFKLTKKLFKSVSQTLSPQGILATVKIKEYRFEDMKIDDRSSLVICENLQDPGNLGTIIRTADSANCCGVVLTKGCVDVYNPKVVRSTMSSIFNLPIVLVDDLSDILPSLKKEGFLIIGGYLSDESKDLYSLNLQKKCVFLIGNEGSGLTEKAVALCDEKVKIPIIGKAESLNASVSAAIFMYEHLRQNLYKKKQSFSVI